MQESSFPSPLECQNWQRLTDHFKQFKERHLNQLFNSDSKRAEKYSLRLNQLLVDYSKNRFDDETLSLLLGLAEEMKLQKGIEALFHGDEINTTEHRSALHTALRQKQSTLSIEGTSIQNMIDDELAKMESISQKIQSQTLLGTTGKEIDTIIHIGIGGSELGPRLVVEALKHHNQNNIHCHFVANMDARDMEDALVNSDPETTLVIIASKSFSTLETIANGKIAKAWLEQHHCNPKKHMLAITSNNEAAEYFGISKEYIFTFWSWVGGRYSVWSTIGLPIALALGMDVFRQFLSGAEQMDKHFQEADFSQNIPVILALLDIWYGNFFKAETLAVVPYEQSLSLFPDYLSQLIMESNGKSIDKNGNTVNYQSAPIIWGSVGSNAQHAFFQLLHQGTQFVPLDLLVGKKASHNYSESHDALVANCIAQSEALMLGQNADEQEPYRRFEGNRPSTTILYDQLDAYTLGMLLALYEHRTFVQGWIYNINSFDQWGVELGKKLAGHVLEEIKSQKTNKAHDASTQQLINQYLTK